MNGVIKYAITHSSRQPVTALSYFSKEKTIHRPLRSDRCTNWFFYLTLHVLLDWWFPHEMISCILIVKSIFMRVYSLKMFALSSSSQSRTQTLPCNFKMNLTTAWQWKVWILYYSYPKGEARRGEVLEWQSFSSQQQGRSPKSLPA